MQKKNIIIVYNNKLQINHLCQFQQTKPNSIPPYKSSNNYLQLFNNLKLYYQNDLQDYKKILQEVEGLKNQIQIRMKGRVNGSEKLKEKTRFRRTSDLIQKKYKCDQIGCYKVYGSDISLKLHKRTKHMGLCKSMQLNDEGNNNNRQSDQLKMNNMCRVSTSQNVSDNLQMIQ